MTPLATFNDSLPQTVKSLATWAASDTSKRCIGMMNTAGRTFANK